MADYKVKGSELKSIADVIREEGGTMADLVFPEDFITAIDAIPTTPPIEVVTFAGGTDEQIGAIIDAAKSGTIDLQTDIGWSVGDTRTITIGSFTDGSGATHNRQDIDIVITSFAEYMECGNSLQFDFKESLETTVRMYPNATYRTGYKDSEMRLYTLPALVGAMPEYIKNRLISFSVLATVGGGSSEVETIENNKLSLRSESEAFPSIKYSFGGEGTPITYFSQNDNNRRRPVGKNGTNYNDTWMRSRYNDESQTGSNKFCLMGKFVNYTGQEGKRGLAPFGCL